MYAKTPFRFDRSNDRGEGLSFFKSQVAMQRRGGGRARGSGKDHHAGFRPVLAALLVLLGLATVPVTCHAAKATTGGGYVPSTPPVYCSHDMAKRAIPPLSASLTQSFGGRVELKDVEMLQVQAVIRHGARTPHSPYWCWKNYDINWSCEVTNLILPSSPAPGAGSSQGPPTALFRKIYDEDTFLGGKCLIGQLIEEGYEQEVANGIHLRDAYICDKSSCLFPTPSLEDLNIETDLFLRSDDQMRTMMSGQVLALSFLDPPDSVGTEIILPWHTDDYAVSSIYPNAMACPRLADLKRDFESSSEYIARYLESDETRKLNETLASAWGLPGRPDWANALDCVMTTTCTGRELPSATTPKLLDDIISMSTWRESGSLVYADSAFAKLAMGSLLAEMRSFLLTSIGGKEAPKFVLYGGHDTTVMPLLAVLAPESWDQEWAPYASMVTIEVMRIHDEHYFRLLYNGDVLVIEGCSHEVCPIKALLDVTSYVEDPESMSCKPQRPDTPPSDPPSSHPSGGSGGSQQASQALYSGSVVLGFAVACFIIGALTGVAPLLLYQNRFHYSTFPQTEGPGPLSDVGSSDLSPSGRAYQLTDSRRDLRSASPAYPNV